MSVKKTVALHNRDEAAGKSQVSTSTSTTNSNKKRRINSFNRWFSFIEVSMEPASVSSLNHLDSNKFKAEIKRWAKTVVAYARQVGGRFGKSIKTSDSAAYGGSSRTSSQSHA